MKIHTNKNYATFVDGNVSQADRLSDDETVPAVIVRMTWRGRIKQFFTSIASIAITTFGWISKAATTLLKKFTGLKIEKPSVQPSDTPHDYIAVIHQLHKKPIKIINENDHEDPKPNYYFKEWNDVNGINIRKKSSPTTNMHRAERVVETAIHFPVEAKIQTLSEGKTTTNMTPQKRETQNDYYAEMQKAVWERQYLQAHSKVTTPLTYARANESTQTFFSKEKIAKCDDSKSELAAILNHKIADEKGQEAPALVANNNNEVDPMMGTKIGKKSK